MWATLKKHIQLWAEETRPDFCKLYFDTAKEIHMQRYFLDFRIRAADERDAMESLDKPPKGLIEFRRALRYVLNQENIGKEHFIEHLIIVKEAQDR